MNIVKTIQGDDGKPYICLEDIISSLEIIRNEDFKESESVNILNGVINTLIDMESQYYQRILFKDNGIDDSNNPEKI